MATQSIPPQEGLSEGSITSNIPYEESPVESDEAKLTFLVIGAGSRGNAYASALKASTSNVTFKIAEPIPFKREAFANKYMWSSDQSHLHDTFESWQAFLTYETHRRNLPHQKYTPTSTIDGVFICTLDSTHASIITALAPLNIHIMSEKPLATTWADCLLIYRSLQPPGVPSPPVIFSTGHVLRYSPHNILLHQLLLADHAIGDILSIEHTEPVGWWHFSHSYVRGNWRKERATAPSLLTKSCHDIDLLLWLLCSPPSPPDAPAGQPPHLPKQVSSTGSLLYFKNARKPARAGAATNCLSCPAERDCLYSAVKIYDEGQLGGGNAGWPVNVIDPEIEDLFAGEGRSAADAAAQRLRQRLGEDYDAETPPEVVDAQPWFGRCVYECENDVCDDQIVNMSWEDDPLPLDGESAAGMAGDALGNRGAKNAVFHMVASTEKQCQRRGRVYGTRGEVEYDGTAIRVVDFASGTTREYLPRQMGGGHGGGDAGLAMGFYEAVRAVKGGVAVEEAQRRYLGCTLEEVVRSHGMVFAAEEARRGRKVVDWGEWWGRNAEEGGGGGEGGG